MRVGDGGLRRGGGASGPQGTGGDGGKGAGGADFLRGRVRGAGRAGEVAPPPPPLSASPVVVPASPVPPSLFVVPASAVPPPPAVVRAAAPLPPAPAGPARLARSHHVTAARPPPSLLGAADAAGRAGEGAGIT